MQAPRVAGTCYVKADGEQFSTESGLEVPLSDFEREPVMDLGGPAGYKETAMVPYVKLTAIFGPNFPRERIVTASDMTVTAELANGTTYVLSGAWLANQAPVKGDEGKVDLEFNGMKGIWQ